MCEDLVSLSHRSVFFIAYRHGSQVTDCSEFMCSYIGDKLMHIEMTLDVSLRSELLHSFKMASCEYDACCHVFSSYS